MVISSLGGGGAERAVAEFSAHWASLGHSLSVVTWDASDAPDAYPLAGGVRRIGLNVRRNSAGVGSAVVNVARRVLALRLELLHARPDVLVSFMDSTNVVSLLATRGLGIPVVIAERTDPEANVTLSRIWRLLRRLTYRWASQVVVQTRAAADWLDRHCATRAVVIPNLLRHLPPAGPMQARERMVVSVGRLAWEKDPETLIRAFAAVFSRRPDWRLVLVGEGPLRDELAVLTDQLGLGSATQFAGFARTPEQWMARAALFVLSSRFEGFPNALLEAMAMGVAVVSTDCPSGPREMIENGVNGRLFQVGDVQGLAALLAELMDDEAQRARLAQAATEVRNWHSPERIMAKWDAVLQAAVGGRAA